MDVTIMAFGLGDNFKAFRKAWGVIPYRLKYRGNDLSGLGFGIRSDAKDPDPEDFRLGFRICGSWSISE
jgi:hypothetical protein